MLIDEIEAPGFTEDLKQCVKGWGISYFTQVQVAALKAGIVEGRSQIVCAPTSSGKTLVGEMAILAALERGKRCLYLVSHKALADQKYSDFSERFGDASPEPRASVGLSTGDRDEGEVSPQLLVATYEKALALMLSGQLELSASVVVADELQILGEDTRGPNIETLCAIFRRQGLDQFVALTATIGNAQELADWLNCALVSSHARDVELHQEIWNGNSAYRVQFGQEIGAPCHAGQVLPTDAVQVVRHLINMGRGPVLVFTESRNEASDMATRYSQSSVRTVDGMALAQQLELFSEPTESSQQLQQNAQKRVAFHTADLTSQERQVVEKGFVDSSFDVCFATSTLAAGVNFPFKSVVFPKLTYQYGDREGRMIARSDYRNMSGRAGRLGLHPEGFAILLPRNQRELAHANTVILPDNDNIDSQLVRLSMRRTVLALVTFGVVNKRELLTEFFQHSFYWHQIQERNPKKLDDVIATGLKSADWLIENKLVEEDYGLLLPTPVGKAVAQSGLLPTTAMAFLELLGKNADVLDREFERHIPALIHLVCGCDEFSGNRPSRFLPWPAGRAPVNSNGFLLAQPLLGPLDRTDNRTNQCAHALILFSRGEPERNIRHQTNIPSGQLHRLATDIAWVLDGLRKIASVPELGYSQTLTNQLSMLARQIQWGAPAEALDMLRVAQREGVPGFGRQRALALLQQGIQTFDQLLASAKDTLSAVLGSERRTTALLSAVATCLGFRGDRYRKVHIELAAKLGLTDVIDKCSSALGEEYETAMKALMEVERSWTVTTVDDGKQQNVPDLLLTLGNKSVLIECKTTTKNPPMIKKEDAFAVMQKAVDFDPAIFRATLGKPGYDEHSKKKVQAAKDITLIEHDVFVEGMLRVCAGKVSPSDFIDWIAMPGLTELERLGGSPSYEILREL
ncbi:helicase [Caulobacter ginsengisoli]|uniref:Helicase n=1 Tax=Caulobacter ginsengisoli TaxID=400775 RepID=A0ABU0IUA0_9CAUL|nr:DEAD/DEAH box helicase [Caulobacter ginsengisoli]MDQ0465582.1 helicase [Caulobacter ginsengisoli]